MATSVIYGNVTWPWVNTLGWERTFEYDGPTYLYTRFRHHFKGYISPASVAYLLSAGTAPGLVGSSNWALPLVPDQRVMGPQTDMVVRHWLGQPRQSYQILVDGQEVLRSPYPAVPTPTQLNFFECDANNGPFPTVLNVKRIVGMKTYEVEMVIETCLNEYWLYDNRFPCSILSHRWRMEHDIDQDAYTTRTVVGHCVFDAGKLSYLGNNPDDYRGFLMHAIPIRFRRGNIHVVATEDNNELLYSFVDKEQAVQVVAAQAIYPGLSRIEMYHTAEYSREWNILNAAAGLGANANLGVGLGKPMIDPNGPHAAQLRGHRPKVSRSDRFIPPTVTNAVVCRVWGAPNSRKENLTLCAQNLCELRLAIYAGLFSQLSDQITSVTHDVMGKWTEVKCTFRAPPIVTAGANAMGRFKQLYPIMPIEAGIGGIISPWGVGVDSPASIAPTGRWVRGTYLGETVANMLLDTSTVPTTPPTEFAAPTQGWTRNPPF